MRVPNQITAFTVVLRQCDVFGHIEVLGLLLCSEYNSFLIPHQRGRSRVVFTVQHTVAYSNGLWSNLVPVLGPAKCSAVSVSPIT